MRINSNEEMFGFPVMKLREFFKRHTNEWDVENVMCFFDISINEASKLMKEFEKECFIEKAIKFRNKQLWRNSIKGNALALASAAKPIFRATAEKKIQEFLTRVKEVNKNDYYLYKIKKALVFGSYLGNDEKLGDIDIAIEIVPKEADPNKQLKLGKARSTKARDNGRQFGNYLQELFWPQEEVLRYLKSRSRSISIHFTNDPVLKNAEFRVIYEEN